MGPGDGGVPHAWTAVSSHRVAQAPHSSSLGCPAGPILLPKFIHVTRPNPHSSPASTVSATSARSGAFSLPSRRWVAPGSSQLPSDPQIRRAARELLKLDDKDPKRLFEGNALIRRLVRIGVLDDSRMRLDYVLALKTEDFLERRLQTQVFKLGLAKSVHHARVLIRQRHIRVGKQVVNVPSFVVRLDSQKHIDYSLKSPYGGGRPGRVKRKRAKAAEGGEAEEEDEE